MAFEQTIATKYSFLICDLNNTHTSTIKNISSDYSINTSYKHGDIRDKIVYAPTYNPIGLKQTKFISKKTTDILRLWKGHKFIEKLNKNNTFVIHQLNSYLLNNLVELYLNKKQIPSGHTTILTITDTIANTIGKNDLFKYKCNSRKTFTLLNLFILTCKQYQNFVVKKKQQQPLHHTLKSIPTMKLLNYCIYSPNNYSELVEQLYKENYSIPDILTTLQSAEFKHMLKLIHPDTKYYGKI